MKGYLRSEACDRNILTDMCPYIFYKKFLSEVVSDGEEIVVSDREENEEDQYLEPLKVGHAYSEPF